MVYRSGFARRMAVGFIVVSAVLFCGGGALMAQTAEITAQLAPDGRLRVGVYLGSPLSMVKTISRETHGLSFDLGHELARRLGVPVEVITYSRIDEVIAGMKAGVVDFTVSNASPARGEVVDFSQTLLSLELGYLVPVASRVAAITDIDRAGIRVGVTQGSTSERTLPKLFVQAIVIPAPSLKVAIEMMNRGQLDAFATNKPILFEMSDAMPGARILDGRWGVEHIAVAIPKGREHAQDYLRNFVADIQNNGLLKQATESAELRGIVSSN